MEITFDGDKVITAHLDGHVIRTDQPVKNDGQNSAPAPYDLFLASIGTCAGIYVKSFCDKREISSENIKIVQSVEFDSQTRLPKNIKLDIQLPSDFPEKYKVAVINAAELCAVKKTINNPPEFLIFTSQI
ncbi:MAG: osmotically inducible protein OsmC [Bacteroidia bacterium]|nr:MAG: osmotically inducible protein OsmC [Bacteroidia bacterium]